VDATTTLAIGIVVVVLCVMLVVFLLTVARRQQTQLIDRLDRIGGQSDGTVGIPEGAGSGAASAIAGTSEAVVLALSQRIAAVEGQLPGLADGLRGFVQLGNRLSLLESQMPSVQEALEKYTDAVQRSDKRVTERGRRSDKTRERQTAADAVSEMMPEIPAPVDPNANPGPNKRAGVLGQGARGRI